MALPKITIPTFTTILPSTKQEIVFRPFVVKEEKVLLVAMESKDLDHMQRAMIDVLSSCITTDIDVNKLPSFDIEYLFLKVRAKSVSEEVTLSYRHVDGVNYAGDKCEAITEVKIDLDQVEVKFDTNHSPLIKLTDTLTLKMRYPTIKDLKVNSTTDDGIDLVANCIESVYDNDDIFEPDDIEDAKRFLGSLSNQQFLSVMKFFETMPTIEHTVTYKCPGCGQNDTVTLRGLSDFF